MDIEESMSAPADVQHPSRAGMVSTVITSYNKGPYLAEAIESALCQDYAYQEVIVVDDGSTDNTRNVAESFRQRIRYYYQTNQGPAGAKNRGILLGIGEYVAFLDGDDRWRPGKLRRQIEAFEKSDRVGVVYGPAATISLTPGDAPKPRSRVSDFCRGQVLDGLIVRNIVPFSSAVVRRRSIVTAGMLDYRLRIADDYEFWLRVALQCEFDFVDEIVVDYRVGVDQIGTRVGSGEYYGCAIQIQREFVDRFFDGKYPRPDVFQRGIAAKYAELGDCLLGAGDHVGAFLAHSRALCLDPWIATRWKGVARDVIPNGAALWLKRVFVKSSTSPNNELRNRLV